MTSTEPTAGERPAVDNTEESTVTAPTDERRGTTEKDVTRALFGNAPAHLREALAAANKAGRESWRENRTGSGTEGVGQEEVQAELRARKLAARLSAWATTAPADYAEARLTTLAVDQFPRKLDAWLRSDSRTLWLIGNTGTGKTHAGWALLHAGLGRDYLVRGWEHNAYLAELRPGGSLLEPWQIRKRAQEADLLLLDDFGAEMEPREGEDIQEATEFVRRETITLLNHRLGARKRQIISTNHDPEVLNVLFGDRIISRLRQDAQAIRFVGPDRRVNVATW